MGLSALLGGCGAASKGSYAPARAQLAALQGSPPALAALHDQADELLSGGRAAFDARLRALRGHPVVVNKWASWCGPCQSEFPTFQQVSVGLGRRVAFLGIDGRDHDAAAAAFLRRFPVSYPSFTDPQESIARSLGAATYFPETLFFDARGRMVFLHAGPYETVQDLRRDVLRYALGTDAGSGR